MFLSADDQCRGKITTEICLHIHTQYPLSRGPFNVEQIKTPQLAGHAVFKLTLIELFFCFH